MQKKRGAFTLVEVMITIVIMAVLIGLLFEIFVTIGRIAVFIQLNRTVHSEMIYVSQTLQNMVDDQDMNITGLDLSLGGGDSSSLGWKTRLSLADQQFRYTLEKECETPTTCYLNLSRIENQGGAFAETGSVQLTNSSLVHIESFAVRTLPYISPTIYTGLVHEGFWFFMDLRVPQYDSTKRRMRVQQNVQLFFTMRKYD